MSYFRPAAGPIRTELDAPLDVPAGVMGEYVPLSLIVARSSDAVLRVARMMAYAEHFEFALEIYCRPGEPVPMTSLAPRLQQRRDDVAAHALPADLLCFAIEYSDGTRLLDAENSLIQRPPGTKGMRLLSGGTAGPYYELRYLAPLLAEANELTFVAEWPQRGVSLSRHAVDAQPIYAAAAASTRLWDD